MPGDSAMEAFAAVRSDDVAKLRQLLDAEPATAANRDAGGLSLLMTALYHHHRDQAELIRSHLPALDVFEAAAYGDALQLVDVLRTRPEQARAWSADGFTALHLAAFFDHAQAVRCLLEAGADPNAVSRNAMRVAPLHSAATRPGSLEMVGLLLDAGANPNARQRDDFTPLMEAAQNGDAAMARLLLDRGAEPFEKTSDGQTAAAIAVRHGHAELALALERQEPVDPSRTRDGHDRARSV